MNRRIRILSVFGTRPEAIKMAPVVLALRDHPGFDARICVTAQHREILDEVLEFFDIAPEFDLDLMRTGQDLTDITIAALDGLKSVLAKFVPDRVLVHGDTSTTLSAALAAFYARIPVAHVEAGLRTGSRFAPWPEEMNRRLAAALADLHFAPTETARRNLLAEGVAGESILVTGNTVIDSLGRAQALAKGDVESRGEVERILSDRGQRALLLVTGHRRESFGPGIESICRAVERIASRTDTFIVFPVHPNPNISETATLMLSGFDNVRLVPALRYPSFIDILGQATLILTDSGGVQEEACALGKPVLVMRDATDRPETVASGAATIVGTEATRIAADVALALDRIARGEKSTSPTDTFGDGTASTRIVKALAECHDVAK